jgi:AcrR family transcriptional regulator
MAEKASRKRGKAAKIDRIIETTRKLIQEKGYVAATTNHIAKAAGVSVGLVYKYFPLGKGEIAYRISLRDHSAIVDTLSSIQLKKERLPKRLHSMFLAWIDQHRRNAPFIRAMNIAMLSNPALFGGYAEVMERTAEKVHPIFWPLGIEGLDNSKMKKLALALFHTIESVIHRHVLSVRVFDTDEELAEFLTNVVLVAIEKMEPHS